MQDCTDVVIRGLTIDYSPTLAQGVVLAVDADAEAPSFTATFDSNFLQPCPEAAAVPCKVGFWDSDSRSLVRNVTAPAAVNVFTPRVQHVAGDTWRIFVRGQGIHGIGLARSGQLVTVFNHKSPHSYQSPNCSRITLEDVSIFGGSGMGVVDGGGEGGSTYRRLQMTRRPLQRGVGMVALAQPIARLLSTNEDGFHSNGNSNGPQIIDSTIAYTGDDLGNICSAMSVVLGQFDGRDASVGGASMNHE